MSQSIPKLAAAAAALLMLAGRPAFAQRAASTPTAEDAAAGAETPPPPPGFPSLLGPNIVYGGEVQTHLQSDLIGSTGSNTHLSLFNDTDATAFVNYRNWASLNAEGKLERNRDDNADSYFPDRNAFFRSEGVTLRQVFATVRPIQGLSVYAGKIHPNFGSAYEDAPGQFYNFGTDYEQDERVGVGFAYLLPVRLGPEVLGLSDLRLSAETFFLDTSFLSTSFLSAPGLSDPTASRLRRYTRDQYGPSNTGGFDSGTISLRGGRPERGLAWQVSLTHEGTSMPGGRSENGQSIGGFYDPSGDGIPLGDRLGVTPFLEYAHFTNFTGIAGLTRNYAIAGLNFTYARYNVSFDAGMRNSAGAAKGTDHQENVSFTYELPKIPRLLVGAGINLTNIDGKASKAFSPSVSYTRAF